MNQYEQFISEFLAENKEVSLEKIGTIKTAGYTDAETNLVPAEFIFDPKAATTSELIDYISSRMGKSKMLVASDIQSHLTQAREFINIGKAYEIINIGFIKKNNAGIFEMIPASQAVKAQKNFSRPATRNVQKKKKGTSLVQLFTLLIVLAILGGLGYEAYEFFISSKNKNANQAEETTTTDSLNNDTTVTNAKKPSADTVNSAAKTTYDSIDTVNVHYVFEKTNLLLRAQSRTAKLISYGNVAGYDSVTTPAGKTYSLYLLQKSRIADTARIKDSLSKYLQKNIEVEIAPNH